MLENDQTVKPVSLCATYINLLRNLLHKWRIGKYKIFYFLCERAIYAANCVRIYVSRTPALSQAFKQTYTVGRIQTTE